MPFLPFRPSCPSSARGPISNRFPSTAVLLVLNVSGFLASTYHSVVFCPVLHEQPFTYVDICLLVLLAATMAPLVASTPDLQWSSYEDCCETRKWSQSEDDDIDMDNSPDFDDYSESFASSSSFLFSSIGGSTGSISAGSYASDVSRPNNGATCASCTRSRRVRKTLYANNLGETRGAEVARDVETGLICWRPHSDRKRQPNQQRNSQYRSGLDDKPTIRQQHFRS